MNNQLSNNEGFIIEIYKNFYNKIPNFKNNDIEFEIQCMMYILSEFGITLFEYSDYILYSKVPVPVSYDIKYIVNSLKSKKNIDYNITYKKIPSDTIKTIKEISYEIGTFLEMFDSNKEGLIELTSLIYINKYIKLKDRKIKKIIKKK